MYYWTLRKINEKYLEKFEMCCWRRLDKVSDTDLVRNAALRRVK